VTVTLLAPGPLSAAAETAGEGDASAPTVAAEGPAAGSALVLLFAPPPPPLSSQRFANLLFASLLTRTEAKMMKSPTDEWSRRAMRVAACEVGSAGSWPRLPWHREVSER
jgi:hypothetical protein